MPWIIGIDEAGYGPNLGPLVMTLVACRAPAADIDLWEALKPAVRRQAGKGAGLAIDDSKLVHAAGLDCLEAGVLAALPPDSGKTLNLEEYIEWIGPASHPELRREVWYQGQEPLPLEAELAEVEESRASVVRALAEAGLAWGQPRSVVVGAARFNELVDRWETKGAVLGQCLAELLQSLPDDDEPVSCHIDKHGGRNHYSALLQHIFADGFIAARKEGRECSTYQVLGLKRLIEVSFLPRADSAHLCVALASMVSKYLRESLMRDFNRYWQERVPGLKATAGYPGDADRFYQAILPVVKKMGLAEDTQWRKR